MEGLNFLRHVALDGLSLSCNLELGLSSNLEELSLSCVLEVSLSCSLEEVSLSCNLEEVNLSCVVTRCPFPASQVVSTGKLQILLSLAHTTMACQPSEFG